METKGILFIAFGMLTRVTLPVLARPSFVDCFCKEGLSPLGGFPGLGGISPFLEEPGCGVPLPPPVFLPVPQPVPVRVPAPKSQSVTIPNIIVALLPPKQKPAFVPRPIGPSPVVLPIPSPRPFLVPTPYEGECSPCC